MRSCLAEREGEARIPVSMLFGVGRKGGEGRRGKEGEVSSKLKLTKSLLDNLLSFGSNPRTSKRLLPVRVVTLVSRKLDHGFGLGGKRVLKERQSARPQILDSKLACLRF